ncbi:MAG TPA: NAD(P)/FAD-dependent oxidoreductase [Opitutaceae bacterium]|nr:NAD(P)/FAD-dependent oxidoreductase [Opitutaceae bacterium]HPG16232.1 NAD(P)/FAD-dependent oxidoreductase [Opitutaceae bacterium]HPO00790.1 NAD(P)/FAD-dependent oxidoreductase [Opitutaceae bacterium]
MTKTYDFIAIGGGSAGFNGARVAHSLGKRVAIIDGARDLGGLCIQRGCMPSKTLLWSTEILHRAQKGKTFGLRIPSAGVNMPALQARKQRIIGEFADFRLQQLNSDKYTLYRSQARFLDPHTIELDDGLRLQAGSFLIATGSRVSVPPVPGLPETPYWTSDDVLALKRVPESVIMLGGGIVACELAQFLRRIGSRVIQIQRSPQILKETSPEAGAVVAQAFRDEGIELHTGTSLESVSRHGQQVEVRFVDLDSGRSRTVRARHLVNALGREPLTDGLALGAAGVELSATGRIRVNRWQQTTQPHIYAGGDVCGPHDIVHLAVAQGELAARHAAGVRGLRPVSTMPLLGVVFTSPAVARIGASERELRDAGTPHLTASYPFNDHGKSILMDECLGYVKVLAEPQRGRILGAEIVGPEAGELIHCFSGPLAMKATVFDILKAPWYHPTLAEILTYPLEEIAEQIAH